MSSLSSTPITGMKPTPSRRQIVWPSMLPAAALMGLVLPISFLSGIQSYLFYLRPLELLAVYGTSFVLFLPFALALVVLTAALQAALARTRAASLARVRDADVPLLGFGAVLAFGLNLGIAIWLAHRDPSGMAAAEAPRYRWAVLGSLLAMLCLPPLRRIVAAWVGPAIAFAGLGLLTLPAVLLMGWETASIPQGAATTERPNILLITFDALTASRMSVYGSERTTTPHLARYTRDAAVFERFYANSNYTTSSINSIVGGTLPWDHHALHLASWPTAQTRDQSLVAQLRRAGYRTLAVSTNPFAGPYKNGYGVQFDAVASDCIATYFGGRDGPSRWLKYLGPALDSPLADALWRPIGRWSYGAQQAANLHFDPALVFDAAKALLAQPSNGPVFLWIHLLPPHSPYATPLPYLGHFDNGPHARSADDSHPPFMSNYAAIDEAKKKTYEARYDESLLYLDEHLGRFLAWSETALGPRTLTLVSADHGESFGHGYGGHSGPLLSEELLRIPLIVKGPSVVPGRLHSVASQIDLAPTLAEFAGAATAPGWQGRSLAAMLRSGREEPGHEAWAMNFEQSRRRGPLERGSVALVADEWKYVRYFGKLHYAGAPLFEDQLFHLPSDPRELRDLHAVRPDVARDLRTRIDAALAAHQAPAP